MVEEGTGREPDSAEERELKFRCADLSGLPPAYVTTMEFDPLRDEGIFYALNMMRDGVNVELHSYPGTFHGSGLINQADVSKRDTEDSIRAIRRALAG